MSLDKQTLFAQPTWMADPNHQSLRLESLPFTSHGVSFQKSTPSLPGPNLTPEMPRPPAYRIAQQRHDASRPTPLVGSLRIVASALTLGELRQSVSATDALFCGRGPLSVSTKTAAGGSVHTSLSWMAPLARMTLITSSTTLVSNSLSNAWSEGVLYSP
jgi:hypothetical protein